MYISVISTLNDGEERYVSTPENGGSALIPEGEMQAGSLYGIAHQPGDGQIGLVRLDLQVMAGNGSLPILVLALECYQR